LAGSHRAPRARRERSPAVPPWAIVVAVVLALIPASYLTAHRLFDDSSASPRDGSTDIPIPPVSPSATKKASSGPSATPSRSHPPATLPRISPDAPRRLVSGDLIDTGFDNSVTAIEPASTSEVARLDSRGSPGSPGTDTVYVIGTVTADGAFANLADLKHGSKVSIQTDNGTMTYTVSATTLKPADRLSSDPLFTAHKPGRLVLVGIRYDASGDRLDDALVVTAQLSAAKKA
jgi:hypothetical protein